MFAAQSLGRSGTKTCRLRNSCHYIIFARVRQTLHKLQVSIVDTRRVGGRVQHEHVAGLGSIETPPSVADRVAFWRRVHDRLPKLSNRIDATTQGRLMGELLFSSTRRSTNGSAISVPRFGQRRGHS